jgi:nitroimidazol reductase NimA-like FMN-containing flavoprotein (pyridoxamine 5'-phosphate oxidase superfamily)
MVQRKATSTTNLDIYGNAVLDWDRADRALSNPPSDMQTWFLGTVDPDGRPHATGVGAFYLDGDMYFTSGPGTRKSRNLAANPACTISVALAGIDVVLEGEAERVTDSATLEQVAAAAREGGWPAQVEGDALTAPYSAPSAGPAPWHLYRLKVHTVYGVATAEPYGATRWRFS